VTDNHSASGNAIFTWAVTDVTVPTITGLPNQSNNEGAVASLAISASDTDGDILTYSASGLPAGLSINSSTGLISGTIRNQAANGSSYIVTVTASVGTTSGTANFIWTVTDVTIPMVTNPGAQNSNEGAAVSLAVSVTDSDGDTLTYSASGLPTGLSINAS